MWMRLQMYENKIHTSFLLEQMETTYKIGKQIPVTLMVAPACERETDIKGKKIRKKIQVTNQPYVKNTLFLTKKSILGDTNMK